MAIKTIRATGTLNPNTSGATTIGSTAPLGDSDDATYVQLAAHGAAGCTAALEPLTGYESGDPITLHVRVWLPPNAAPDAYGEFFLATDAAGFDEFAGFSDGSVSGFGFHIPTVGEIVEVTAPLRLTGWGTTVPAVVAALEAGVYVDINALYDSAFTDPAGPRVHEVWIEVGEGEPEPEATGRRFHRKWPREHGRHWPRPTHQHGARRAGGYT